MYTGEFNAGCNPTMEFTSHPRGSRNTPCRIMLQKLKISISLMGHLACTYTQTIVIAKGVFL